MSLSPSGVVIDVSNSYTKFAPILGNRLGKVESLPTPELTRGWVKHLAKKWPVIPIILSSVVPRCTALFQQKIGSPVHNLHGKADLGFRVDYPQKAQIGSDRLANAIAAREFYGWPCIVLDFGTAVTFDVIDSSGAYCGGVIAPGLNAMTDYLHERTALLPRVTLREPLRAVGKSTEEAILSGAMIGYRGMIREILHAIRKEKSASGRERWKVVATGGQAKLVTSKMTEVDRVHPHLTLEGLRIWAQQK